MVLSSNLGRYQEVTWASWRSVATGLSRSIGRLINGLVLPVPIALDSYLSVSKPTRSTVRSVPTQINRYQSSLATWHALIGPCRFELFEVQILLKFFWNPTYKRGRGCLLGLFTPLTLHFARLPLYYSLLLSIF
jgi:hypothetical protein